MNLFFKRAIAASMAFCVITSSTILARAEYINEDFCYELTQAAQKYYIQYPQYAHEIDNFMDGYLEDEMLYMHYLSNPETALDNFASSIEYRIGRLGDNISPAAYTPIPGGMIYYCDVDYTIVQEGNTWCGAASALMALSGIKEENPSALTSTTLPSQQTIWNSVKDNSGYGAVVYKISNYLNSKIKDSYKEYIYTEVTADMTYADLEEYIIQSLSLNRPVILHSKPYLGAINYYDGFDPNSNDGIPYNEANAGDNSKNPGHYLVIDEYNSATDTYSICDCTYVTSYQGRHTGITIEEIYDSLYRENTNGTVYYSGRYIIHAV